MATLPEDMKHLINYDEKVIWVIRANETVVVTDQRIIIRKSAGLGLRKSFVDYPYSNMVNIKLDRGLRSSTVEILMRSGVQNIRIGNLGRDDAYQLHRIIREGIVQASGSHLGQPFPIIIQGPQHSSERSGDIDQICRKCARRVSPDFTLCPYCGYALKIECPECGKHIERKFKLCPYCGEDVSFMQDVSFMEDIDLEL